MHEFAGGCLLDASTVCTSYGRVDARQAQCSEVHTGVCVCNLCVLLVSNIIVLYVSCLEVWPAVVVSYCCSASCACIAKAAQQGMAWSLHTMMVFFRSCHSAVGLLARAREVLFSSLTLAHSRGLMPSSTIMPSSWWPSCSRWSRMVTQDVAR